MLNRLASFQLILVSGILYGLSFPPTDLHLLIFVSLALLLHTIRESKSLMRALGRAYLTFFISSLIAISWIALSGMQENADRFLILAGVAVLFVYPLFFLPAAGVTYFFFKTFSDRRLSAIPLIAFPFVWTSFEYLSTWGQITFPWLLAGNSQTSLLGKIQFIEFTGVYGLSFWICAISALIYFGMSRIEKGKSGQYFKAFAAPFAIALALYFLPDVINPAIRTTPVESRTYNIGIIQPNINPWVKWGGKQKDLIDDYLEMISEMNSKDSTLDLVVLPETAFPYYFKEFFFEQSYLKIKKLCDSLNLKLLSGSPDLEYYESPESAPKDARIRKQSGQKFDAYNSAVFFEPGLDKESYLVYHKIKLVPGSERMPYQEHLPFIKDLIEWGVGLGSWQIGSDTVLFRLSGDDKFSVAICYESVFPGFYSEFIRRGAGLSVIITNDGWWGKLAGTYQHSKYAVLRAIENRRWIVRCANTGISSFIDPDGNMHDETAVNEKALLSRKVGYSGSQTFYTRHGDLFADLCLWFTLALLVFAAGVRKISPKGRVRRS